MDITMIVPYFKPEITANIHLMDDLAHDFAEYGARVTVITGFPLRGTCKEVRKKYFKKPEECICNNVRIIRTGSKRGEGKNFFIRGMNYIIKTICFYKTARRIPADIYYIYSSPPVMGVIGGLLSKRAPTLYGLQDIFPDNLAAQGKLRNNSIFYHMLQRMEDYIYRNNTRLVTISNDMRNNLSAKHVDEKKLSVIGNWIDVNEVRYIERSDNHIFDQFKLDRNTFYVTYCGNLGYAQDLDLVLDSAKQVQREVPEIQFVIVGNGACESGIKRRIAEEGIRNISMRPLQPEEYSAYVYSLGDIGIVTLKADMQEHSMPSKTWTMMAASQPVLCTAVVNSQLYEVIRESEAGIAVKPGDYQELTRQIIELYHDRSRLKKLGANGRAYAEANLTRKGATMKYYKLMQEMADGRNE